MSLWRCICPCMPLYSSNGIVGYMMGYIGYMDVIGMTWRVCTVWRV